MPIIAPLLSSIALASSGPAIASEPGTITVTAALRVDAGQLLCALYSSADGFMSDPTVAAARAVGTAKDGVGTCSFRDIAPGRYAIALLHDEDGDLEMDTKLFGIPAEGFGASNDASPRPMGPPSFDAAAFAYDGQALSMTLLLRYY